GNHTKRESCTTLSRLVLHRPLSSDSTCWWLAYTVLRVAKVGSETNKGNYDDDFPSC
ncbi:Uncharacterized protein APZ42_027972, partial [Daphnia magna]